MNNLRTLTLTNTTNTSIPIGLCQWCSNLKSVTFKSNTLSIGNSAFAGCENLSTLNGINSANYMSIGSSAFYGCSLLSTLPFAYFSYLGSSAFAYTNINQINILSYTGGTTIGSGIFYSCANLSTANIVGLSRPPTYLFPFCSNLSYVSLNSTITSFPSGIFQYCSALSTLNRYTFESCVSVYTYAFTNTRLKSLSLPKATLLSSYAFYSCTSLETIYVSKPTSIGSSCFRDCFKLKSIYFSGALLSCSTIASVFSYAFYSCYSLSGLFSLSGLSYIGSNAFRYCSSLTALKTGSNTVGQTIGSYAFANCTSLTEVSFPTLSSIYSYAFASCTNLSYFIVPSKSTTVRLQSYIFSGCDYNKLVLLCEQSQSSTTWSGYWNKTSGTSSFLTYYSYNSNNKDYKFYFSYGGASSATFYTLITSLYCPIPYSTISLTLSSFLDISAGGNDYIYLNGTGKTFNRMNISNIWAYYSNNTTNSITFSGNIRHLVQSSTNTLSGTTNYCTFIPTASKSYTLSLNCNGAMNILTCGPGGSLLPLLSGSYIITYSFISNMVYFLAITAAFNNASLLIKDSSTLEIQLNTKYNTPTGATYYEYSFTAPSSGDYCVYTMVPDSDAMDTYIEATVGTTTYTDDDSLRDYVSGFYPNNACLIFNLSAGATATIKIRLFSSTTTISTSIPFKIVKGSKPVDGTPVGGSGGSTDYVLEPAVDGVSTLIFKDGGDSDNVTFYSDEILGPAMSEEFYDNMFSEDYGTLYEVLCISTTTNHYNGNDYELSLNSSENFEDAFDYTTVDDIASSAYDSSFIMIPKSSNIDSFNINLYDSRGNSFSSPEAFLCQSVTIDGNAQPRIMRGYTIIDESNASYDFYENGFFTMLSELSANVFSGPGYYGIDGTLCSAIRLHFVDTSSGSIEIIDTITPSNYQNWYDAYNGFYLNFNGYDLNQLYSDGYITDDGWINLYDMHADNLVNAFNNWIYSIYIDGSSHSSDPSGLSSLIFVEFSY